MRHLNLNYGEKKGRLGVPGVIAPIDFGRHCPCSRCSESKLSAALYRTGGWMLEWGSFLRRLSDRPDDRLVAHPRRL